MGKIFQLTPLSFAFDFGLRGEFLFVNVDPVSPRLYLIQRRTRDLEKQSVSCNGIWPVVACEAWRRVSGKYHEDPLDRIVRSTFRVDDELADFFSRRLIVQLTGRTANLFLLDELNRIVAVLRAENSPRCTSFTIRHQRAS